MKLNYNNMKKLVCVLAVAAGLTACQMNYEKTKSGFTYKIAKGKGGEKLKPGAFLKFNISYTIPEKNDTTLNSTFGKVPVYAPYDTSARSRYSFMEVLSQCNVGDSITFTLSVDTLKKMGAIQAYDKTFSRGGQILGKVKIIKQFASENDVMADYQNEMQLETQREVATLEQQLKKEGVKVQKTKNGAFVEITEPGDASLKADSGKQAAVMYRGYLQSNKQVFDTNMDSSKGHTDPYVLTVGAGQAIRGWDEALPYFGKGGKGKVYIPPMLGYGPQGNQGIPPFSTLVFDIEIKDVKTPAPAPAAPAAPVPGAPAQGGK
jgi:FKBP-type peptidyl-prolyl cis-trans isomerase